MIRAFSPTQRIRIILIAGVVPLVIAVVGVIALLSWTDLPDPIAVHWGPTGSADGYGSLLGLATLFLLSVVAFAAIVTVAIARLRASTRPSAQPRFLVGMSVWFATLLTAVLVGSVGIQRGLEDAAAAPSVLPVLGLALVAATLLGLIAGLVAPKPVTLEPSSVEEPRFALAPEERAVFTRTIAPSRIAIVSFAAATILVIATAVLVAVVGRPAMFVIIAVVSLVLVLSFASLNWRLRIGRDGVRLRAAGGYPRFTVPIDEIAAASVVDVQAMAEFGGWGIRFGAGGRTGVILRSGEALEITRHTGRSLVVTVDDAATAAGLVNGLVQRSRA
ncbi:DUF1648 domain-containing protein [Glaciihabitans arcticus]|uniref:DUF1648 domain-containing protein n=1 Tax=Glaciihabitans arcticus TaxID=2668039 RepID=A0A4Q9GV33_9MICO|nr:DUF1648 domain-containing protein [Glaciihabitans arcticus]TBN57057.1 DUF1648 domain-containing protein [Glaciihabitans arcticus]